MSVASASPGAPGQRAEGEREAPARRQRRHLPTSGSARRAPRTTRTRNAGGDAGVRSRDLYQRMASAEASSHLQSGERGVWLCQGVAGLSEHEALAHCSDLVQSEIFLNLPVPPTQDFIIDCKLQSLLRIAVWGTSESAG